MNRRKKSSISGGIYLVVDPAMQEGELFRKLEQAMENNEIAAVQVWDNFSHLIDPEQLIQQICHLCHLKKIPVLINNSWELLKNTDADGLHLDEILKNFQDIKTEINQDMIVGITCNNDLSVVEWANENQLDYISFCSIFTSSTSNSCDLVDFKAIKEARKMTTMPIFLAGGINKQNVADLKGLDFDGIAVISGIMASANPKRATEEFGTALKQLKNENSNHK